MKVIRQEVSANVGGNFGYERPAVRIIDVQTEGVLCYSSFEENEEWDETLIP